MSFKCVYVQGVRFPKESCDEIQEQKQLLKDAATFLISSQIPALVSDLVKITQILNIHQCCTSVLTSVIYLSITEWIKMTEK